MTERAPYVRTSPVQIRKKAVHFENDAPDAELRSHRVQVADPHCVDNPLRAPVDAYIKTEVEIHTHHDIYIPVQG